MAKPDMSINLTHDHLTSGSNGPGDMAGPAPAPPQATVEPYYGKYPGEPGGDEVTAAAMQNYGYRAQPRGSVVTGPKGSVDVPNPVQAVGNMPETEERDQKFSNGFNGTGESYSQAVSDEAAATGNQSIREAKAQVTGAPMPERQSPEQRERFAAYEADQAVRARGK